MYLCTSLALQCPVQVKRMWVKVKRKLVQHHINQHSAVKRAWEDDDWLAQSCAVSLWEEPVKSFAQKCRQFFSTLGFHSQSQVPLQSPPLVFSHKRKVTNDNNQTCPKPMYNQSTVFTFSKRTPGRPLTDLAAASANFRVLL